MLKTNSQQVDTKQSKLSGLYQKIKVMVNNVYIDLTTHWKKPAKGNYVSYKEIVSYSLGGFGQQFVIIFISYLALSSSNMLLGSAIGLQPVHLQLMLMVQQVLGVAFSAIRAKVVDNTNSKFGRFRPYILTMGFPVVVLSIIFVFLPFDTMTYTTKLAYSFIFSTLCANGIGFLATFYTDTYNELRTVISPSSLERGKVIAISSLVFSMAPTIYYAIMPMLSNFTGGFTHINTYRYGVMPFAIIGVLFGIFGAIGTKERIIVSETYTPKVSLLMGLKHIYRNKAFVIRTIASVFLFLRTANIAILNWIFIYDKQNMALMSGLNLVIGTASGIAMFLSPFVLKKLGTRKTYLLKEFLPIIFSFFVLITLKNFTLFFIFIYLQTFVLAFTLIIDPVIHGEVKDYQQYISGKRFDFTFGTAGALLLPITLVSGLLIPYLTESLGITKNYDALYDPQIRNGILYMMCVLSFVGSILCFIPILFYDLTTSKYENIVKVLKVRAMFENYSSDNLCAEDTKQGVELIREAQELYSNDIPELATLKVQYKTAKEQNKKQAYINYNAAKLKREQIISSKILIDELDKFNTERFIMDVAVAEKLMELGLSRPSHMAIAEFLDIANALPEHTKEQKEYKKQRIKQAKAIAKMYDKLEKQYGSNVVEPNVSLIAEANAMPANTYAESRARRQVIKSLQKTFGTFDRIAMPYVEAKKLLRTKKSYESYDEIAATYENACLKVEEEHRIAKEKEQELAAQRKAELEKAKVAKLQKKQQRKANKENK